MTSELMRASDFQRSLLTLPDHPVSESGATARLGSRNAGLMQDLMRFEQEGRPVDLLEVLAAGVRHACSLTVRLRYGDKVLPLTLLPYDRVLHCPLDLRLVIEQERASLGVLQVGPAAADLARGPLAPLWPLAPLLWSLAVHGERSELLPEVAGAAVYRVSPAFDAAPLGVDEPLQLAVRQLRREVASLREIAHWPGMNVELAMRLLNALYLQTGLIISRSHPAALTRS